LRSIGEGGGRAKNENRQIKANISSNINDHAIRKANFKANFRTESQYRGAPPVERIRRSGMPDREPLKLRNEPNLADIAGHP